MIKIRQSYHGTGGREGYKYEVYSDDNRYIGRLDYFPLKIRGLDTVRINDRLYIVTLIYDSPRPEDDNDEVVFYELEEWEYTPNYDIGYIKLNPSF